MTLHLQLEVHWSPNASLPLTAGLQARRGSQTVVKVLTVSRSNNVSIMLTQFQEFAAGGPMALRAALLDGGADLGVERLSLLLQVG